MPHPTASEKLISNYRERHCIFEPNHNLVDEKLLDHGHVKPHYEFQNHSKIAHHDQGHLSLNADLSRIQHGYYHDDPACLVNLHFQFGGSSAKWRYQKADVRLSFTSKQSNPPPIVVDYGPKHLASMSADEQRSSRYTANLSANSPPILLTPTPALPGNRSSTSKHHSASAVEGVSFSGHDRKESNIVRFWIREDPVQKDGLPLEFDCAVIVKCTDAFRGTVDVKAGPIFDFCARPWPADDPALFDPAVEYGDPVSEGQVTDFARLNLEDWRSMVTPSLNMDVKEALHRR